MKKLLLAAFIFIGAMSMQKASAQIHVSINIGSQPAWAPVGYDHVNYYYLPDINSYYDVTNSEYIYLNGNRWYHDRVLPPRYHNYNIYNSYKVIVNRQNPYRYNREDVRAYAKYKGHRSQPMIRDSREERYYQNKGNVHHEEWQRNHGQDHGNGHNHGNKQDHGNGQNHGNRQDHGNGHDHGRG